MPSLPPEADVIIVGAGTAGCVLAARLSEDPDLRVLVVEAGRAARSPWIHIPVGFSRLLDDAGLNWCYETESQAGLAGRTVRWPRGKVVGGSSAINGMVWVRGAPHDFDRWAATVGDPTWSWTEAEALFRACEAAPADADARLGRDGRMPLARPRHDHPLVSAFIEAGVNAGLAERRDLSISDRNGVGPYLTTIRRGLRVSAASTYLKPALRRDNVELATASTVCGLTLASGHQAVGVRLDRLGTSVLVRARRGVILAAGAVDTPKLLMLSGIGSGPDLARLGIPIVVESPDVGRNLQDHFGVRVIAEVARPVTINDDFRRPWRLAGHVLRYAIARTGPIAMGGAYAGAFFSCDGGDRPDMQIHFLPLSSERRGWTFHRFSGVTANVCQLRPASRGRIDLGSADPAAPPCIDPCYLSDERDRKAIVAGLRFTRELFRHPPFSTMYGAEERMPGERCASDAALLDYARTTGSTVFHPVGTCRMGKHDGVVDSSFRVRGTRNLWVADASVMPHLPSGNTNAATLMLAERAARILKRAIAPRSATTP